MNFIVPEKSRPVLEKSNGSFLDALGEKKVVEASLPHNRFLQFG